MSNTGPWPDEVKAPAQFAASWQRVQNETWPEHPRAVPRRPQLYVWARIVWERDDPEWLPGHTVRWNQRYVLVVIGDPRLQTGHVWLAPRNVRRRDG